MPVGGRVRRVKCSPSVLRVSSGLLFKPCQDPGRCCSRCCPLPMPRQQVSESRSQLVSRRARAKLRSLRPSVQSELDVTTGALQGLG